MPLGLRLALSVAVLLPFVIAPIMREVVFRLKAGPVRFRLALASQSNRSQASASSLAVMAFFFFGLLSIPNVPAFADSRQFAMIVWWLLMPILWFWLCTASLLTLRRDAKSWLALASGLLSLAYGALILVIGFRALQSADHSAYRFPGLFMVLDSVILFVIGAAALQEYVTGTGVREGGITMFWITRPWSRIVVKDWLARQGGFDLVLTIRSPQVFGMQLTRDGEAIVPVSARERPALEAFLTEHTAAAGESRAGEKEVAGKN